MKPIVFRVTNELNYLLPKRMPEQIWLDISVKVRVLFDVLNL